MRGRKSEPAEVKEAKGNPGRRPTGKVSTAQVPVVGGGAPSYLDGDAARFVWDHIVPTLRQMNLARVTDEQALARYCHHVARFWELTKKIDAVGGEYYETESAHGRMVRVHPAFRVRNTIEMRIEALEDRLGLNVRARQEIMYRLSQAAISPTSTPPTADPAPSNARDQSPLGLLSRAAQVH